MATYKGKRVSRRWRRVLTAADKAGVNFLLTSGRRTMGEQWALFRLNMVRVGVPKQGHPLTAFPNPLAPHIAVGRQAHAIDVNSLDGGETRLESWLEKQGADVTNPVPGESWHMVVSGRDLARLARRLHREANAREKARKARATLRNKARAHGARYVETIVAESERADLPVALGFALIEQESGFRNVFGHDPTIFAGAGTVTEEKYKLYRAKRGLRGQGGMQGVGPAQLTWFEYQDRADKRGGCWKPEHNIAVGFDVLASHIKAHGTRKGLAVYNGGSSRPSWTYADQVLARRDKWRARFSKKG